MNRKYLRALTLFGPSDNSELGPLAVQHFNNRLFIIKNMQGTAIKKLLRKKYKNIKVLEASYFDRINMTENGLEYD